MALPSWSSISDVHDMSTIVMIVAASACLYFFGKFVIELSSVIWGAFVFAMTVYFLVTPADQNNAMPIIQHYIGKVKFLFGINL